MRRFAGGALVVFLYMLSAASALAQEAGQDTSTAETAGWDTLNARAKGLQEKGQYERAAEVARAALKAAEEAFGPDHPNAAAVLNNLGKIYRLQARYAEADTLLRRSLHIREEALGPNHPDVAASLHNLAALYSTRGKYVRADSLYGRSLAIREKSLGPEHIATAETLNGMGIIHKTRGKYAKAELLYKRALAIREEVLGPEHARVAYVVENLANLYKSWGRYALAEPLYKRALSIKEKALGPDHPLVASSLNNLAVYYQIRARYAEVEPLLKRALDIKEKVLGPEHPSLASSLYNLGLLYATLGRYAQAEPLCERALAIREKTLGPEHHHVASSLTNLAFLYHHLGRVAGAGSLHKRALAIKEKALGPEHPSVAFSLNNLANVCQDQARYAEAESLHKRALAIREKALGPEHPFVASSLNNLAALYRTQGRYVEAEPLFKRALTTREEALGPDHPDLTWTLYGLGTLYKYQGKYAQAASFFERVLKIREETLGPEHYHVEWALYGLALLEVMRNRPEAALPLMRRGLAIDDRVLDNAFSLASERQKLIILGNMASRLDILQTLVSRELLSHPEAVRTALGATLRRKGLVLDALSRERAVLLASDDPRFAEIARQLHATASQLASLMLSGPGKLDAEVYRGRIAQLEEEREKLEEELASLSGVYAAKQKSRKVDAEEAARALDPGSVLVEYFEHRPYRFRQTVHDEAWGANRYLAFVLPAGKQAEPVLIDLGEAEGIDEAVHAFRQEVGQAGSVISELGEAEAERRLKEKGKKIYNLVFTPLKAAIREHRVVYLAPDGELNLIPFGVLSNEQGRYLSEIYQFNYLSSGRDLLRLGPDRPSGSVVVVADPDYSLKDKGPEEPREPGGSQRRSVDLRQATFSILPGTRREAEAISDEMSGQQIDLYLGDRALEGVVKRLKSPRILHLATHGFFLEAQDKTAWLKGTDRGLAHSGPTQRPPINVENPLLRSGLVLAGANHLGEGGPAEGVDDGILTALEISGIYLWNTSLVVLSACETGLGETHRGEGVFGLRRAFQLAGARTVVMSLWSVPDEETAALMQDFYRRMNAGTGKARALQEASLALMKARRQQHGAAHPFFWGAFVCVGEP